MNNKLPRVAITHGDTNGIGYELILKALSEPEILEIMTPIIYGTKKIADIYAEQFGLEYKCNIMKSADDVQENRINFMEVSSESVPVKIGTPTIESANMAAKALQKAIMDYTKGAFDVLVTAPTVNDTLTEIKDLMASHSDATEKDMAPMTLISNGAIATTSIAGKVTAEKAAEIVSEEDVIERAKVLHNTLRRDLSIDIPRIAILSFGEEVDSNEGSKDMTIIAPSIAKLRKEHIIAFGPISAKDIFEQRNIAHFDGILGIYNGQVADKLTELFPDNCVIMYSGMPIAVTAPTQEPSFEIAGKNVAYPDSMLKAIHTAVDIARNRHNYDTPRINPLPKLYHEHREDGDKARFIPKKGFNPKEARAEREARMRGELITKKEEQETNNEANNAPAANEQ